MYNVDVEKLEHPDMFLYLLDLKCEESPEDGRVRAYRDRVAQVVDRLRHERLA